MRRISYSPYKLDFALEVVGRIAKGIDSGFEFTEPALELYTKLIQYFHADSQFPGDLTKGIMLHGPTGTGKTLAMKVMSVYQKIDNVRYIKDGRVYLMNFDVIPVNDIVGCFISSAFDGIQIYANRYVLCMDDVGTEIGEVLHYGNRMNVVGYIISERQAKRLLTFATSNLKLDKLEERYGDRIMSRMYALFNFIIVKDKDFRRVN